MTNSTQGLREALIAGNYLTEAEVLSAEREAGNIPLERYVVERGIIHKDLLGQAMAELLRVPYADLNSNQPAKERVLKIPESAARTYRAVLFKEARGESGPIVATDDPKREGLPQALEMLLGKGVTIAYSLSEDIDTALLQYSQPLETRFQKIIESSDRVAPEIVDEIFSEALSLRASDIHFEPRAKEVVVRFRIDGVLHETGHIPKEQYENILNRLKVLAHERIDEHRSAQDGVLRFERNGQTVDMRSSVVPTVDGEKVVLRVLSSYVQSLALDDLGLSPRHERLIRQAIEKPFGMLLVTGPTGSGKTTTLYALLQILNHDDINITTIEDPVEYKVQGINQIQVDTQTSLTFAEGLRTIVRQDPDVILVGEIRDNETAEIAVNAALTGHLLFSTFHANDAATAIPRLLDMKVEPFLLSSTLVVVIAQRLARRICEACKVSVMLSGTEWKDQMLHAKGYLGDTTTLYRGKGCSACGGTGFKGRVGIFECIEITPELQECMLKNPSAQEVWALARSQGAISLYEDGIEKVKGGVTTLDELARVAEPPESVRH